MILLQPENIQMRLNLRETMSTLVTSQIDHMQVNNFIV